MNILVIEDLQTHRDILNLTLRRGNSSLKLYFAEDAFQGYNLLRSLDCIDVILLDNSLPYALGSDLLKKIRSLEVYKSLPVVIVTSDNEVDEFLHFGANSVLMKPYTSKELFSVLEEVTNAS